VEVSGGFSWSSGRSVRKTLNYAVFEAHKAFALLTIFLKLIRHSRTEEAVAQSYHKLIAGQTAQSRCARKRFAGYIRLSRFAPDTIYT
jgi:hypothetical protein